LSLCFIGLLSTYIPVRDEQRGAARQWGTVTFKYDPMGRRIYKSSSAGTSIFAYDGADLVEETNSSGAVVARYQQGENIDEPLAILRSGATSYYHADGLGSVTSLSSTAGTLAQTYTFDSFGNQTASSGSLTNPFRYTGREFDSETNLYYYRARYVDSNTGRFLSEDPTRFDAGVNFYAYVWDSPVNGNDPSGLDGGDANGHAFPPYSNMPPDPLTYKPGIPRANGWLRDLLVCMGNCYGKPLVITSTNESNPRHPTMTPHWRREAADIRYPSDPGKLLCCAGQCGAGFALDEKLHPSAPGVYPHIHVQIPAGRKGGHGDIPASCPKAGGKPCGAM
jgi:RHS repeat-associated protein